MINKDKAERETLIFKKVMVKLKGTMVIGREQQRGNSRVQVILREKWEKQGL